MDNLIVLNDKDKSLLLTCINSYIEKIDFVLKNRKYYFYGDDFSTLIIDSFKEDKKELIDLREKIFSIEISSGCTCKELL